MNSILVSVCVCAEQFSRFSKQILKLHEVMLQGGGSELLLWGKKKKKTLDVHESGNVIPVYYTQQARVYKKQRDSDGRC